MNKQQLIDSLDSFTRGYITCLLFTTNEDEFPEYCYSGEFGICDEDIERFSIESLNKIKQDCLDFQEKHAILLKQAGSDEENGIDLAYSRNGHGTGYFDRDYDEEIREQLQEICRRLPERYLWKINKRVIGYV